MAIALPEFIEVRFPRKAAFGFEGGDSFFTSINTNSGGFEQRNANWEQSLRRFQLAQELKSQEELDALIAFFNVVRGKAVGFRFLDERDYCTDMTTYISQVASLAEDTLPAAGVLTPSPCLRIDAGEVTDLSVGDGVATDFQLNKQYTVNGTSLVYNKYLVKPVATAIRIYVEGVEQTVTVDYTVDSTTGVVSMLSPVDVGDEVTCDCLYDLAARFDTDRFSSELESFNLSNWRSIAIVEERLR